MKRSGWAYIDHMFMACEELLEYTQGISSGEELRNAERMKKRAVVMCLLDLGELCKKLDEDERNEYPSEHWHKLIGFRNRSAHGYHELSFEIVYNVIKNHIPPLYDFLIKKMSSMEEFKDV